MNMSMKCALLLTGCLMFGAGCSTAPTESAAGRDVYLPLPTNKLIAADYRAADALMAEARPRLVAPQSILVATVVDIDDLDESSTLGRLVSEHVSARFTGAGYHMVELKFQKAVYMKQGEGELMLTRQIREIANSHDAQAVIVGTYSEGADHIFLNLKLVHPEDNLILAAHDYALMLDEDVRKLVRKRKRR